MDWFRRNWPDLLIGIALVAVIAGIIATLITGGSFFPVGQNTRTSTPPAQSSPTQSAAPKAPGAPSTAANPSGGNNQATSTSQNAGNGTSGAANNGGGTGTTATAPSGGGVSVLPPNANTSSSGGSSGSTASAPAGGTSSSSGSGGGASATATAPSSGSTASSAPASSASSASAGQPSTAGNGPGAAAPYRVSVGAFSHKDYAQRQEETFKKAGYPVFLASQGDLTIVLVGPYTSQSQAEQVASKIKSGGYGVDPVVYQFQGTSDQAPAPASSSGSSSNAGNASGTSSAGTASSASNTSSSSGAAAPSGERYLQVGAYGTADSAKPQRDRLENMGFAVQERTENGLVKLLIGPFGPDRLQQVESQLKSAGIDSFPR